jgi:hypothetical protein
MKDELREHYTTIHVNDSAGLREQGLREQRPLRPLFQLWLQLV